MFGRQDERPAPLAVTVHEGPGATLLLLHGLTGSAASWMRVAPLLGGYRLIIPDLLGFGRSPKPDSPYDLAAHCAALAPLIAETRPVAVVGHSMGGMIALGLLQRHAELAAGVLVNPALYESRQQALVAMGGAPWLQRTSLRSPRLAHFVCETFCMLRPLLQLVAPLFARDLPGAVARASLDHSWASYSRTLDYVVLGGLARPLLDEVGGRVTIIHGEHDRTIPLPMIESWASLVRRLVVIDGDHEALLLRPEAVAREVIEAISP